jgi:predicted  nucleic acid-binding Zn-ribbon protein
MHNFLLQPRNLVSKASSPQTKMSAELGETFKSRYSQKHNTYLPEAPLVDLKNKDKTIHEHHEVFYNLKNELGLLQSVIHKFKVKNMTCQCEELITANKEKQLTIVNLQNRIDILATELKSTREAYQAGLNQEKSNHIMTKNQCKNLYVELRNVTDSCVAAQKRLSESQSHVEQLTNANQSVEAQKPALEEQVQALTHKLDQQHETEKLSARLCELTATLSAVQKRNTDYQHETEELRQKLDHQEQCAMVAKQQIATLQDQVLVLTAELECGKNALEKARDHIASLAAEKENGDKITRDLISALPPAVQEFSNLLVIAVYDDLPPFCSMWNFSIPVSTA